MDRYLIEFQEIGKDYFTTDCGFREGQEDLARQYVRLIVGTLKHVVAGRVLDTTTRTHIYTLRPQDKLAVNIEMYLHWLVNNLAAVDRSSARGALSAEDAVAIKQQMTALYAVQIANLMQP